MTIGDDASIDDASLIAHINTRGIYRLNPLSVGKGCVLKSGMLHYITMQCSKLRFSRVQNNANLLVESTFFDNSVHVFLTAHSPFRP